MHRDKSAERKNHASEGRMCAGIKVQNGRITLVLVAPTLSFGEVLHAERDGMISGKNKFLRIIFQIRVSGSVSLLLLLNNF